MESSAWNVARLPRNFARSWLRAFWEVKCKAAIEACTPYWQVQPTKQFFAKMLGVGLEPTRDCSQGILSPQCLPFHHPSKREIRARIIALIGINLQREVLVLLPIRLFPSAEEVQKTYPLISLPSEKSPLPLLAQLSYNG